MIRIISDFFNLIFPNVCVICDEKLVFGEKMFCTHCLSDIPKTNFTDFSDNPVAKLFWGRISLEYVTSFFYFDRGSKYRKLLHKFKYKGKKEIGLELGKIYGEHLLSSPFSTVDFLIPIPLHQKRLRSRGYNQSDYIADGIGKVLNKPVLKNVIERKVYNISQTGKKRYERWKNVDGIFVVKQPELIINKHILLIDDIITTGSTIEACAHTLMKTCNCLISACSLAVTKYS